MALVTVALFGCTQNKLVIPATSNLNSISLDSTGLVLEADGSASIDFKVTKACARFNHDISSSSCSVVLRVVSTGNAPENYEISSIEEKDTANGIYTLTVTDLEISTNYSDEVRIAILKGSENGSVTYLLSNQSFTVTSSLYTPGSATFTGLPVVYIDTEDDESITSKKEWVNATLSIDGAGDYDNLDETSCLIRGHGNSTWKWAKKPYAIKFESKTPVMGLPKHKKWILLANFMDRTLMRNAIAYDCGQQTSLDWTPHYRYCELVLNGKHHGNYMFVEQVKVDKNRVDITEMEPNDNSEPEISGGYLFELDFHFDNDIQWHTEEGIPFSIKYPDDDDITTKQVDWAKNYIATVENTLYGDDYLDDAKGYKKYIDLQSFVDYWLIYELMVNH